MTRLLFLSILLCLFFSNCKQIKIAKADEEMAQTHKIIWEYINTYHQLFPELKPPKVKYNRSMGQIYFNENRSTIYLSNYEQLNKSFKKRIANWSIGLEPTISPQQVYEDWYLTLDLAKALSLYLADHVGLAYQNHGKRIQDMYILSWIFLRENSYFGKNEQDWIRIIRHINIQARGQLSQKEVMVDLNRFSYRLNQSPAYYTYFNTLLMLKSYQLSRKIAMDEVLHWFELQKKEIEQMKGQRK